MLGDPVTKTIGTEIINCEIHGPYEAEIYELPALKHMNLKVLPKTGHSSCPKCLAEKRERDEQEKLELKLEQEREKAEQEASERRDYIHRLHHNSGIPERHKGKTLAGYEAKTDKQRLALGICQRYVENMDDVIAKGRSIVMSGGYGTGKTHLAVAIAEEFINHEHNAKFANAFDIITGIKNSWREDTEYSEQNVIDYYSNCALLVVDEAGVQFGTDSERLLLWRIFSKRYEEVMPTILISNLGYDELAEAVSVRVLDRLRENGGHWVSFDWDSYRQN